jgi:hypothetical protein
MKGLTGIANIERDKSISSPHRVMPVGEVVPAMTQGGKRPPGINPSPATPVSGRPQRSPARLRATDFVVGWSGP